MKLFSIQEADRSPDPDVKLLAIRASRYRTFGSPERIQDRELGVVDLRGATQPEDFDKQYEVLDRHRMLPILLVKRISTGS